MLSRSSLTVCMAALLMTVIMLASAPATLHAQLNDCPCEFYTFVVDKNVKCKVTICWKMSPQDAMACETISGGGELLLYCPAYLAGMYDCDKIFYPIIGPGAPVPCTQGFPVSSGAEFSCCLRQCISKDAMGCTVIRISNADCSKPCN